MSESKQSSPRWGRIALVALNVLVWGSVIGWRITQRQVEAPPAEAPLQAPERVPWTVPAPPPQADVVCPGCNIVLVSIDILRADHLPCLGYPRDTAPNLCRLAEHSALFENFVVHAYQTPISQMAMMTAEYPSVNGFDRFSSHIPADKPYLPELLAERGYQNTAFGSSFEVMSDMSTAMDGDHKKFISGDFNPGLSFGRGFERFVYTGHRNLPTDALTWLRAEQWREPFFLWLPIGTLHWPYGLQGDPAEKGMFDPVGYDGLFADEERLGFAILSNIHQGLFYPPSGGDPLPIAPDDVAYIRGRYDYGIVYVDRFLGHLLDELSALQLMDRTLVVVHGVHGEDLGEHGYFLHYDIYDTEVKSMLLVYDPQLGQRGLRIAGQVQGIDLAPTLLGLVGQPGLTEAQGISQVPAIQQGEVVETRPAFVERIPLWEDVFRHYYKIPGDFGLLCEALLANHRWGDVAVRTERWKLIHRKSRFVEAQVSWWTYITGRTSVREPFELYDLQADPTEQVNVIEAHPQVAESLKKTLLAWEEETYGNSEI